MNRPQAAREGDTTMVAAQAAVVAVDAVAMGAAAVVLEVVVPAAATMVDEATMVAVFCLRKSCGCCAVCGTNKG